MISRLQAEVPSEFVEDALTCDAFLGGRIKIWQPSNGYRAGVDPVFLAAAVPARAGQSVLDLGCGAGVAMLCLAARVPILELTGVERQAAYAALARRNAKANGIASNIICADLADLPPDIRKQRFDHVIANPPYFRPRDGSPANDMGREHALREATSLGLWIDTATRRLAPKGFLTFILRADRLPDILAMLDNRLGDITVYPLVPRSGRDATRVIISARKGTAGTFRLAHATVLHQGETHETDGEDYTPSIRAVLRDGAALPWNAN